MTTDTRRRILDTARKLYNQRGVHRVGVRDVARAVGMSPGNLAYHFPTKDDLVSALILELHGHAQELFGTIPAGFSLIALYELALASMRRTLSYRFVLLSYADAVAASPVLQELEEGLWRNRQARYAVMMDLLVRNRYIDGAALGDRRQRLYEQGEMISSGWLVAAAVRRGPRDDLAALLHYAKLGCALLEPYCTAKGQRQMRAILDGRLDQISEVRSRPRLVRIQRRKSASTAAASGAASGERSSKS